MKIVFVPMLLLCLALLTGCGTKVEDNPAVGEIKSYRDIPGITEEEISAIEELKATKRNFLYGQMLGTEAFILPDGRYAGFAVKLCELMTDLYEIPFELELYEWNELMSGLDGMRIDFTGDLTPNPQRMQSYYMTEPILERGYKIFLLIGTDINEKNINGKKIGFLTDSTCRASVGSSYSNLGYEAVDVADFVAAAEMIRTGQIDAFVTENIVETFFEQYDFIHTKDIFPLAYAPVSLSTANPQLAPIISVMNKYLSAGGVDSIFQMYEEGENQYTANKLSKSFTNEEKIYLSNLSSYGRKVNLALESDIYPISFYNKTVGHSRGLRRRFWRGLAR